MLVTLRASMYSDESSETFPSLHSLPDSLPCKSVRRPGRPLWRGSGFGGVVFNNLTKKRFCLFFQILADRSTKPK